MAVDPSRAERPADPALLAYWLMAQAAMRESPTGVDGLADAVFSLIAEITRLRVALLARGLVINDVAEMLAKAGEALWLVHPHYGLPMNERDKSNADSALIPDETEEGPTS